METLYKVLIICCLLFLAAGMIYIAYFLPEAPASPQSLGNYNFLC